MTQLSLGARVAEPGLPAARVVGMRVDRTSYVDAVDRIARWAEEERPRAVGIATVNNVMEAVDDPGFAAAMDAMDIVTPDGMPLVWALKLLGHRAATRVTGTELTERLLAEAEARHIPVAFHGGAPDVLETLVRRVGARHPALSIRYAESPPFRRLTDEEEAHVVERIVASGARIVFVGLGCPKQELWQARVRDRLPAVTIGVGAAFDFLAGRRRRAPATVQRFGLEWAFRLAIEPRRLWRRYLRHNPRFVIRFGGQLARRARG